MEASLSIQYKQEFIKTPLVPNFLTLLCFVPFRSILFRSILFHSVPFRSIPFHSVPFRSVRSCERTINPKQRRPVLKRPIFVLFVPKKEQSFPGNDAQPYSQTVSILKHFSILILQMNKTSITFTEKTEVEIKTMYFFFASSCGKINLQNFKPQWYSTITLRAEYMHVAQFDIL